MISYSITHMYQVRFKTNFIEQKCYRTCMWHLNKVWNINFVDDNEILAIEKEYCKVIFLVA